MPAWWTLSCARPISRGPIFRRRICSAPTSPAPISRRRACRARSSPAPCSTAPISRAPSCPTAACTPEWLACRRGSGAASTCWFDAYARRIGFHFGGICVERGSSETSMRKPIRRVVTGHDAAGRSVFITDAAAPHVYNRAPGSAVVTELWETRAMPADNSGNDEVTDHPLRLVGDLVVAAVVGGHGPRLPQLGDDGAAGCAVVDVRRRRVRDEHGPPRGVVAGHHPADRLAHGRLR